MTLPRYEPMLASPWPAAFTDPDWLFEVKWDGVRALWCWDGEALSMRSRRGRHVLPTYPELSGFRPRGPSSSMVRSWCSTIGVTPRSRCCNPG